MKVFCKAVPLVIALSVGFGYLCYAPFAGAHEPQDKAPSATISAAQTARARQLFKEKCAKCHGSDGRGETVIGEMLDAPNFTDQTWWKNVSEDKRLIESVRNGKAGMPKFGKRLTAQQIELLVTYVRQFDKSSR